MRIDVSVGGPEDSSGIHVLVDVYKSSAAITTALDHGAKFVLPFSSADESLEAKEKWKDKEDIILAGEKMGVKMQGFDIDISPLDMTEENVKDKVVIYKSDNLSRIISKSKDAEKVLIGGLTNSEAVANYIKSLEPKRVEIIACGTHNKKAISDFLELSCDTNNEMTMEDIIGAGAILHSLDGEKLSDIALISLLAYENPEWKEKISEGCILKALRKVGYERDIPPCFSENESKTVPVFKEGRISVAEK